MATLSHVDVGVDVSKKHLDIHAHQTKKSFRVPNSEEGIAHLSKFLSQHSVGQIVCESTGGYERLMVKALRGLEYKVWQANPAQIKHFIAGEGIKAKTDKLDAKMIALFASQKSSKYEQMQLTEDNEKLKALVHLKSSMTASLTILKTQIKQAFDLDCTKTIQKQLNFIEKQVGLLEKQICALINQDQDLAHKAKIISSIPGVGPGTTATVLALLPELGKISNKEAAALVGVAPYTKQSGIERGQAKISGGRSDLRTIIYMASISAISHNPIAKTFYQRLIDAGKPFKVAIVAVMRKLVIYMNTLVRKGELWNPAI